MKYKIEQRSNDFNDKHYRVLKETDEGWIPLFRGEFAMFSDAKNMVENLKKSEFKVTQEWVYE